MPLEPLLTIPQAAEYLQVEQTYLWRRIRGGAIKVVRLSTNRGVRISETELRRYVESRIGVPDVRQTRRKA